MGEESKVYIGDLDPQVEKHEVEDAFGKIGALKYVWVARKPPGFAFVEYEDLRDAQDAVRHLDGTKLGEKRVRVELSRGRRGGGRGRGGGGGRGGFGGGDRRDFGGDRRDGGGGGRDFAGRDRDRDFGGGDSYRRGGSPRRSPPRRRYSRSRSRSPGGPRGGDRRSRSPR